MATPVVSKVADFLGSADVVTLGEYAAVAAAVVLFAPSLLSGLGGSLRCVGGRGPGRVPAVRGGTRAWAGPCRAWGGEGLGGSLPCVGGRGPGRVPAVRGGTRAWAGPCRAWGGEGDSGRRNSVGRRRTAVNPPRTACTVGSAAGGSSAVWHGVLGKGLGVSGSGYNSRDLAVLWRYE